MVDLILGQFQSYAFERTDSLCCHTGQMLCKKSGYSKTSMLSEAQLATWREKERKKVSESVKDWPWGVAPRH